jgi:hypothetical protein
MSPRMGADVVPEVIVGLGLLTRQFFFCDDSPLFQFFGKAADKSDSVDD